MKKFFSLFIICTMLLSMCVCVSANESEEFGRLTGLGILQGDEGGLRLSDNLTRAEFCTLVARLLQLGDYNSYSDTDFSDVSQEHWASGCISALCKMGLVNGKEDGTFDPDSNIIFSEAVKVLVCAVGYEVATEGGYPNGYLSMASKLGITSGISDDGSAITREMAAKLIDNTLDVVPLDKIYGTNDYGTNSENLTLYEILLRSDDMVEFEGVMIAGEYASIEDEGFTPERGYLTIDISDSDEDSGLDGKITFKSSNAYNSLLGLTVSGYARKEKGRYEIISLFEAEGQNEITPISAEDAELSEDYIEYWEENSEKSKKINFEPEVIYMYNNRLIKDISNEDKIIYSGFYKLLDNDGNGKTDVVFIEEYESFIAEKVNIEQMVIYFANKKLYNGKNNISFEEDDDEKVYEITDADGNIINLTDIQPGFGISVMQSKDEVYTKIVVSDESVSGKVDGVGGSDNSITVNGEEYKLSLNQKGDPIADVALSDEATFIIDAFGKIIDISGSKITKMKYGFVVGAINKKGIEDGIAVKLVVGAKPERQEKVKNGDVEVSYYFQNKEMIELDVSEKAVCYMTSEVVNSNEHYVQNFSEVAVSPETLADSVIGYTTNSENEINKIYVYPVPQSDSSLGNSEFNADIISFGGEATGSVVGRGYATNDSTQFICIPNHNSPSDADYFVGLKIDDESSGNYVYGVKSFFVDTSADLKYDDEKEIQNGQPVDVLVIRAEMQSDNPHPVPHDADICIVGSASSVMGKIGDDEGNEVYKLELLNREETLVEYTSSSGKGFDTASELVKGDLIQYTKDGYGRISRIELVGHIQGLDADLEPNDTREHNWRTEGKMIYGRVANIERNLYYHTYNENVDLITLDFGDGQTKRIRVCTNDGPPLYLYEHRTGWIYPATTDDILAGESSICAYTDDEGMICALVIIEY